MFPLGRYIWADVWNVKTSLLLNHYLRERENSITFRENSKSRDTLAWET